MKYTIAPREVSYRGTTFRSRLEAQWAVFFDLCGFEWAYEPIELSGWVPDFLIRGETPLYVEVKPIDSFDEGEALRLEEPLRAIPNAEPLLLGLSPFIGEFAHVAIGWLGQRFEEHWGYPGLFDFGEAALIRYPPSENEPALVGTHAARIGIAHSIQGFNDRVTGRYMGGSLTGPKLIEAMTLWGKAGNATQWRPR